MQLDISKDSLKVYEALSSETRLNIISLLRNQKMNISDLAKELHISNAIISRHINKLEEANLVDSEKVPGKSGIQKLVFLIVDNIEISFPQKIYSAYKIHSTDLKLGHFTDFYVHPTCGLATPTEPVGQFDDPKYFMDSKRVDADLLWFSKGFVEYKIPNLLQNGETPELLEISFEIASEFPLSNNVWPSDITFYINDIKVGIWTSPGNFSDIRGKYTPSWWDDKFSQYGLLKHLRINKYDTSMDGQYLSQINLDKLNLKDSPLLKLRIAVESTSENVGGLTLFGKGFGNHNQNINIDMYYS